MKYRRAVAAVVVGLSLSLHMPASAIAEEATDPTPLSYMFVLEGDDAQLRKVPGFRQQFELTVPVQRPSHWVMWFTDRPERDAGHITIRRFMTLWENDGAQGFNTDPPNVALNFGQEALIATMTNPRIKSTTDGTKVFQARLTPLQGADLDSLSAAQGVVATHARRATNLPKANKMSLPRMSLFVDAYFCPSGSGPVYQEFDYLCGTPKGQVK